MNDEIEISENIETELEYAAFRVFDALGRPEGKYPADFEHVVHAAMGWQPIETAPNIPHYRCLGWCWLGMGHKEAEARIIQRDWRGNWYGSGCQQKVTHWAPIIDPPAKP